LTGVKVSHNCAIEVEIRKANRFDSEEEVRLRNAKEPPDCNRTALRSVGVLQLDPKHPQHNMTGSPVNAFLAALHSGG